MPEPVAYAEGLTHRYRSSSGIVDLDLNVPPGKIVGLVGPSGSGKTTTVRLLTGLLKPDGGEVRVLGEDPARLSRAARSQIGYMPQGSTLLPTLSLGQNISLHASLYGVEDRRSAVRRLAEFVGLDETLLGRVPGRTSGGEQRRAMLAAALVHEPRLVFLDEPTTGIDPVLRRSIWEGLRRLAADGRSLVVTTQYVSEAGHFDYLAVLAGGRMVTFDTPSGLRRRAYGGDLIDVELSSPPTPGQIDRLRGLTGVTAVKWAGPTALRLTVADQEETVSRVSDWTTELGIEVTTVSPHTPDYDDVFVELMSKEENR